ncbi:MAG: ArsA family ATPase [Vicinamibacteria bacterium]|nr:ArsA family ATPase [Vicinamibacteria bacterium]
MRIILFSGKGGVGKTTLAAATAVRAAAMGHRALVMSTDAAHSLGDSLAAPIGPEPTRVSRNLEAMEIDVHHELDREFGPIRNFLTRFFKGQGLDDVVADEMAVLPGMEELFSLLRVAELAQSGEYDLLLVDCAPTGETLRMLAAPDVLRFYFRKIFPVQRLLARTVRPVAPLLTSLPVPDDDVFMAVKRLYERIERLDPLLRDPLVTSIRIVLSLEKMVIAESERLFTYLGLYGYSVDAVIANRVLPASLKGAYFERWSRAQAGHMKRVREGFSSMPILESPLIDEEVMGTRLLRTLSDEVYGERDPSSVFHTCRPPKVEKRGDSYVYSLDLPFVSSDRISAYASGDELTVTIDNWRRNIVLPRSLAGREVKEARLRSGRLSVLFGGR